MVWTVEKPSFPMTMTTTALHSSWRLSLSRPNPSPNGNGRSGKSIERPPCLTEGAYGAPNRGHLVGVRLDRLPRSIRDLLGILDHLATVGAGFKSVTETWADTTSAHGAAGTCAIRTGVDLVT